MRNVLPRLSRADSKAIRLTGRPGNPFSLLDVTARGTYPDTHLFELFERFVDGSRHWLLMALPITRRQIHCRDIVLRMVGNDPTQSGSKRFGIMLCRDWFLAPSSHAAQRTNGGYLVVKGHPPLTLVVERG